MRVTDFYQFDRISKYGGVYILWDKDNKPLYVGYASQFGIRFRRHYEYLNPLVYSFSIYPTDKPSLLEYTLIQRVNPIYNRYRSWNEITRGQHGNTPYLLNENFYWGHPFYKKSEYPFIWNSPEDKEYLDRLLILVNELKSIGGVK